MNQFDRNSLGYNLETTLQQMIDNCEKSIVNVCNGIREYEEVFGSIEREELDNDDLAKLTVTVTGLTLSVTRALDNNRRYFIDMIGRQTSRNHPSAEVFFINNTAPESTLALENTYLEVLTKHTQVLNELHALLVKVTVFIINRKIMRGE